MSQKAKVVREPIVLKLESDPSNTQGTLPLLKEYGNFEMSPKLNVSAPSQLNAFQLIINVKQFRPEEVSVVIVDGFVVVHCMHKECADEHGFVSREFTRRHKLPDNVAPETIKCSLSQNALLLILAPTKQSELPTKSEVMVPVTMLKLGSVEARKQRQTAQGTTKQQSPEEK